MNESIHIEIRFKPQAAVIRSSKDGQQERINEINRQIKKIEERQQRLLEAIETGTIELDETTQRRPAQDNPTAAKPTVEVFQLNTGGAALGPEIERVPDQGYGGNTRGAR